MTEKERKNESGSRRQNSRSRVEDMSYEQWLASIRNSESTLKDVPDEYLTDELCKEAVIQSPQEFKYVPPMLITPLFVAEVAKHSTYDCVSFVPETFRNSSFNYDLVCLDPKFIWHIPRKALTAKIGKAAIKELGYSTTAEAVKARPELLSRLHTSLYDHETCLCFVQSDLFKNSHRKDQYGNLDSGFNTEEDRKNGRLYLNEQYSETYSLPHLMRWPDVIIPVLAFNGIYIAFVKSEIVTKEMCISAIESNPYSLRYIPPGLLTEKLVLLAFEKDPFLIRHIPQEFITEEMALKAVECSGNNLEYIPDKYKTRQVCLLAVNNNADIEDVPAAIVDKELAQAFLENSSSCFQILQKIPKEIWDYDICLKAVEKAGRDLQYVPAEFIDYNMCFSAAQNTSSAVDYIPENLFTEELALALVSHDQYCFSKIPKDCITEAVCLQAIKCGDRSAGHILKDIPGEILTKEICDLAVGKTPRSIQSVPEKFVTEEMLLYVARQASVLLKINFPKRFRTKEFIQKLLDEIPTAGQYLSEIVTEE